MATRKIKPWYRSKTIWINLLSGAVLFISDNSGFIPIAPETQLLILSGLNIALRLVTDEKLTAK